MVTVQPIVYKCLNNPIHLLTLKNIENHINNKKEQQFYIMVLLKIKFLKIKHMVMQLNNLIEHQNV